MALPNPKDNPPKAKVQDNPKKGTHKARVVGIADLGIQPEWEWNGKINEAEHKVEITYELPESKMQDGRPHWVSEAVKVNFNISESDSNFTSTMMKRVLAINPDEEVMDKNILDRLINRPCFVTVGHNKKGYAKVDAVSGIPGGIDVPDLSVAPFIFDWDVATKEDFESLRSPMTKKKIQAADNYATSALKARVDGTFVSDFDEDVPF